MPSTLIIGGGVGGLFTGAFLARGGHRVTVVEKNHIIGGGLQTFTRRGIPFETGMHLMGGLHEGGSLHRILDYLGVTDRLRIENIASDEVRLHGTVYRLPKGREAFTDALCAYFPKEAQNITRYITSLYAMTEAVPLFRLRPTPTDAPPAVGEEFNLSAEEYVARYTDNAALRFLLTYMSRTYAGPTDVTPAFLHALISVLYIDSSAQFVGGSLQLAHALRDVIESCGGEVLADCEATAVSLGADGRVDGVNITGAPHAAVQTLTADNYVSAIGLPALAALLPAGAVSRFFARRVAATPDTQSAFITFLSLKPESTLRLDAPVFALDDDGLLLLVSPHDGPDTAAAPAHITALAPMSFDAVEPWADSRWGKRPAAYNDWKAAQAEKVVSRIEAVVPDIRDHIADVYTASPLTIRDFYGTRRGAAYGLQALAPAPYGVAQFAIHTRIPNLFLTGQDINLHGLCGTSLTAIETAEALLGEGSILRNL